MSKTEDRYGPDTGAPATGTGTGTEGRTEDGAPTLPFAAYVPMGATSRYTAPEGDRRPRPVQVVDRRAPSRSSWRTRCSSSVR